MKINNDFIKRSEAMNKINDIAAEFLKDHTIQCDIAAGVAVDIKNDVIKTLPAADVIEIPDSGIGDLSDGYHTFNELYHHRAVLFSVICNNHRKYAWKSKKHSDGSMYEGMFIVGIETPEGQATYHYDLDPYWDIFKVKELITAPVWDGHTPQQAIERISTMSNDDADDNKLCAYWNKDPATGFTNCSNCKAPPPGDADLEKFYESDFCPCCGAVMDKKPIPSTSTG